MNHSRHLVGTALALAACAACAQSTVTVFGVADVGVGEIKNKDNAGRSVSLKQERTDGINSSRLGFRGVEDLGGGLKAGFWLEASIAPDTGTVNATKFWNRRSTVSLIGDSYGELRLGRDYSPNFWILADFDLFGTNGVGSVYNLVSTLGSGASTTVRLDNSVSYWLPSTLGGVYGQLTAAAGEGGAAPTQVSNKHLGGRLGYAQGPINIAGAYGETTIQANDKKYKTGAVGAQYSADSFKLDALFERNAYLRLRQNLWMVGGNVAIGTSNLRLSYAQTKQTGVVTATGANTRGTNASLLALGYTYNLSKRTALYSTVSRISNKGGAAFTIGGAGSTLGGSSSAAEFGLRHFF